MHESAATRNNRGAASGARFAFAALMLGNICLAFGPWLVRLADADGGVGPIAAGFWRLALAAPLLMLLTRMTGQQTGRLPVSLWGMIALGGLFFAADLASWHLGILQTKLANATLFGNSTSLIFPIYGFVVARAWPTQRQGLALLLAAAGAVVLMGRSYELSPQNLAGDLLCLLAGLLYTFYLIAIDRARATLQPWPVLSLSTLAGVLPLLLFALAAGESVWPRDWTAVLLLALVSQVAGQGFMVFAMGQLKPITVGLALLSQPVIAGAVGWIVYGEALGPLDLIGAAAIAAAIVLVREK